MGWRDGASHGAQRDIEWLMALTFESAQEQIERYGVCLARAAVVAHDGTASIIFSREDSPAEDVGDFDGWVKRLRVQRDLIRAAAIIGVVQADGSSGGEIRVDLEHIEGVAVRISRTYGLARRFPSTPSRCAPIYFRRRHRLRKGMIFGQIQGEPGRGAVWS